MFVVVVCLLSVNDMFLCGGLGWWVVRCFDEWNGIRAALDASVEVHGSVDKP